jgi:hypothetical protein
MEVTVGSEYLRVPGGQPQPAALSAECVSVDPLLTCWDAPWNNDNSAGFRFGAYAEYDMEITSRLEPYYRVDSPEDVAGFLTSKHDLLSLLLELPLQARHFFPSASFEIEVSADPDSEQDHLVVWINSSLEPDDAIARLLDFTRHWWAGKRRTLHGEVSVSLGA